MDDPVLRNADKLMAKLDMQAAKLLDEIRSIDPALAEKLLAIEKDMSAMTEEELWAFRQDLGVAGEPELEAEFFKVLEELGGPKPRPPLKVLEGKKKRPR